MDFAVSFYTTTTQLVFSTQNFHHGFFQTFESFMMQRYATLLIVICCALIANSCTRDHWLASWEVNALVPIAHGNLKLLEDLDQDFLVAEGDEIVHVEVEEELFRIGLDSILEIPEYEIDTGFFVPFSLTLPPGAPFYVQDEETIYDLGEVQLLYAELAGGSIDVELENTIDKPVLFQYFIYSATNNGDTFKVEERIEANSTLKKSYSLAGYQLNLQGEEGNKFNAVHTFFQAMIHPDETQSHQFSAGDRFDIVNKIHSIEPSYVRGYFGSQTIAFKEHVSIDLFDQIQVNDFDVFEYAVDLWIDNGIGADLSLLVNSISTDDSLGSKHTELLHDLVSSPQGFVRAQALGGKPVAVKHIQRSYDLTQENSNLDALIESQPNRATANLALTLNPLGNISGGNDFVAAGHDLSMGMRAVVPLKLSLSKLRLSDTLDLAIELPDQAGRIQSGALRLYLENEYPIDAAIQGFMLDGDGVVLDSLLENRSVISGATQDGIVSESVIEVPMDQDRFRRLEQAESMIISAHISTTNGDSVAIKSNQSIQFKLVADMILNTRE